MFRAPSSWLAAVVLAAALPAAPLAAQPPAAPDVRDLPLVEVLAKPSGGPATVSPLAARSVAILITGDGDWAEIDRGIADGLSAGGVPVVGLKARTYLRSGRRTPDGLTRDVERIARAYLARWGSDPRDPRWGRDRLVLLGFSRGADFLPFVVNRLAPDLRDRLVLVGMYGAEQAASFEFHLMDLLADTHRATDVPVAPELTRMLTARPGLRAFCVYGADEKDTACRAVEAPSLHKIERGGAHHFDKDYPGLGRLALEELGR